MSAVKLYVYDLSNGLAKSMSLQLTGKQIDGIWHTSIVVFGLEVFYGGQGIEITSPGRSHHGRPLRVEDMGVTAIDRETFEEYLNQMRDHYLGDKYHLLEFNCNSFTNDCVGFLTGKEIPAYVKDLPTEFLSTPFGAALRPTIDAMFRPPGSTPTPRALAHWPSSSNQLLESVAERAAGSQVPSSSRPSQSTNGTAVLSAPLQIATNPAALKSILTRHKAVAVLFTSATCPPCKIISPVFDELAYSKASEGVAFVKVDLGVGMGSAVASEYGVRATPTFIFFNDAAKVKGADASELRSAVDLMIFQAYPPHAHTSLKLPTVRAISLQPILYKQKPNIKAACSKLESFLNKSDTRASKSYQDILNYMVPWLDTYNNVFPHSPTIDQIDRWRKASKVISSSLEFDKLFPLIDFWRLLILDVKIAPLIVQDFEPIILFLDQAKITLESARDNSNPRNSYVTLLRLLSNAFAAPEVASQIFGPQLRQRVVSVIVPCLLHSDSAVRSAAAGVAFNSAAFCQNGRVRYYRDGKRGDPFTDATGNEDWELEMITALLEALKQETQSEEVVHRLTAALALVIHLSPNYEDGLRPLLEVLQAKLTITSKLDKSLFGGNGIQKKEVKDLIQEVGSILCP